MIEKYMSLPCRDIREDSEPDVTTLRRGLRELRAIKQTLSAAFFSQQIYYPVNEIGISIEMPRDRGHLSEVIRMAQALGFDTTKSFQESGIGIAERNTSAKSGFDFSGLDVAKEKKLDDARGVIMFNYKGIKKLIEGGVKNPFLDVLAVQLGIEAPHAKAER